MENTTVKDGKTMAIISYLWWIGLLIAFIMNSSKRNSFASFHIRQMFGLIILQFFIGLISRYLSWTVGGILGIGLLILWVIGFIGAIQGQEKKVPLLGDQFQDWFKSIG